MKLLIICQFFYPDITAGAFRMADTAELLTRSGHEVRVITAVPHKAEVKGNAEEIPPLPEAVIYRSSLHPVVGSGLIPYLRHYLFFVRGSTAAAWRLRRTGWRPDVIWASSPPLFTAITGYASARLFGCPWILDVRDIWPDSAVAAGQLHEGGRAFRIGKLMERFFYKHANYITCVSMPMKKYIASMMATPVEVVYNGVKSSEIDDNRPSLVRSESDQRILLYAGNLGRVQALDILIKAVAELKLVGRMNGWEVRLLGTGVVRDQLAVLVKDLRLNAQVKLLPPVARADVAREISMADALFLSLKPDPALRMTIPSKLFECLAANIPIVAGLVGEGAEIAQRSGGCIVYEPEDGSAALKKALETLFTNFNQLSKRALGNRDVVRQSYTREKAVTVLESVLRTVKENTAR